MTSSNGNIFRVTGPLCGEFTGHRCQDTGHKGQWRGPLVFSLICAWINGWVNNRQAGDLRRYRTHYNAIIMVSFAMDYSCRYHHLTPARSYWCVEQRYESSLHLKMVSCFSIPNFDINQYRFNDYTGNIMGKVFDKIDCYLLHYHLKYITSVSSWSNVDWVCHRCQENAWWRHQMETFSVELALWAGNSPVTGEFPSQ